jgi:hypothetical protein
LALLNFFCQRDAFDTPVVAAFDMAFQLASAAFSDVGILDIR